MPKYASGRSVEPGSHGWWWPNTITGRSAPAARSSSQPNVSVETPPPARPGTAVSMTASTTPGSVVASGAREAKSSPW